MRVPSEGVSGVTLGRLGMLGGGRYSSLEKCQEWCILHADHGAVIGSMPDRSDLSL